MQTIIYRLALVKTGVIKKMNKQTIENAAQAIMSALLVGDTLREALRLTKSLFFKLSRAEWRTVETWAKSEFNTGVKN